MRKATTFLPALALAVAGAISMAAPSLAFPITYTEEATASGSLGATAFTNGIVTLTMNNNTTNIMNVSGVYEINGTATLNVAAVIGGVPEMLNAQFTDTIQVFSAPNAALGNGTVGFSDPHVGFDILDDTSVAFKNYTLLVIGPTPGTATLGGGTFPTNSGNFVLTSVAGPIATFTAAVPAPPIGRGLPVAVLAVLLLGTKLSKRRRCPNPLP